MGENFKGDITYNHLEVSIGGGFDIRSGVFVVPTSGTYRLSFSGQSALYKFERTDIYIRKNGSTIFRIFDNNDADKADGKNLSYVWLMTLSQGDRVNLSSKKYLFSQIGFCHLTFTGELIHIE